MNKYSAGDIITLKPWEDDAFHIFQPYWWEPLVGVPIRITFYDIFDNTYCLNHKYWVRECSITTIDDDAIAQYDMDAI